MIALPILGGSGAVFAALYDDRQDSDHFSYALVNRWHRAAVKGGMISAAALYAPRPIILVPCPVRVQEEARVKLVGMFLDVSGAETVLAEMDLDGLLLRVAANGDRAAFAVLFARTAPRVKGLMMRLGADAATAEELAQETMLRVWQKSAQFDRGKASASTWMFTIARNLRIDRIRQERRPQIDPDDPALVPEPPPSAEESVDAGKRERAVRQCLATLPEDQRQAVQLSFVEGLSHQEIADRLHIPLGTVKSRLRLSFDKLRAMLRNL